MNFSAIVICAIDIRQGCFCGEAQAVINVEHPSQMLPRRDAGSDVLWTSGTNISREVPR